VDDAREPIEPTVSKGTTEGLVYVVAAALAAVALYKARHFYEDDALITLRYARRWIDGSGPTWTDGERVQGYSSPLWLIQLAFLGRCGVDLVWASRALGVLYFGALFALFQRARALPCCAPVLATLPGLSVWAMGGLETVSFAFWCVLAAISTRRIADAKDASPRTGAVAGAALAAAALTRPAGLGLAIVACGWVLASRKVRALLGLAPALVLPLAAWAAFSVLYYGDPLANPTYAKVTGYPLSSSIRDGLTYLAVTQGSWGWAVSSSLLVILLALWSGWSAASPTASRLWIVAMATPIVCEVLVGGGDHMVGGRLILPAVVLLILAAGQPAATRPRWLVPSLFGAAAVLQAFSAFGEARRPDRAALIGGMVGRFLESHLPPHSLAAISVAGSTAFFAPSLRFIDTLGLNDRHIAHRSVPVGVTTWQAMAGHRKGDGEYVLSRSPDIVILGAASGYLGLDEREWFLTDYELLQSDAFRLQYRPYSFRIDEGDSEGLPNLHLTVYLRKGSSAADKLAAVGIRLRGPWYTPESHSIAATSNGVGFQPR
jgi:arabinofuranosyltransferase